MKYMQRKKTKDDDELGLPTSTLIIITTIVIINK